jgi:tetratricopeptide (TPR) repeat protein
MKGKIKMKKLILITIVLFVTFYIADGQQNDGDDVVIGKYRTINSNILGEERRILVNLPVGYETSEIQYPVVFHLYGDFVMTYFANAASFLERLHSFKKIPGVILVGVDNTDRYRDLRPLKPDGAPGGSSSFVRYFQEELIPFIEQNYRTTNYRILVGPQAGACFGYYALMEHPDLFDAFILENSFDNPQKIDDYLITKARSFFKPEKTLHKFLYVKTDSKSPNYQFSVEQQSVIEKSCPRDFRYKFDISDRGNYLIENNFLDGFLELFAGYELPDSIIAGGLEMILKYNDEFSKKIGYKVILSDYSLHHAAGKLNGMGNRAEAKTIYERLLTIYPRSLDGMFQMGMILASEGNYQKAVEYYNEFLKIRPQEVIVKNILKRTERIINESAVYAIEQTVNLYGINKGREMFQSLNSKNPENKYFDENEFIAFGYRFLNKGKTAEAIEIFRWATESFPASFNTWDSLGEAYMKHGDKKKAKENYMKSLELNPDNENASRNIGRMKE